MEARYIEKDGVKYYAVGHSESTVHVPGEGPATTVSEILKHVPTFEDTSIVLEGDQPAINPEILEGINEAKNLANSHIIESGSNDDGYWNKYPNGKMESIHIYGGIGQGGHTINFGQRFISNPIVYGHDHSSTATQLKYIVPRNVTTSSCAIYPFVSFTTRANTDGPVKVFAVGRWK